MTELLEYRDRYASEVEAADLLDRQIEKEDRPVSWAGVASEQSGTLLTTGQTPGEFAAPADGIEYVPHHVRRRFRRAPGTTCLHTTHTPGCGACRYAECWHNHARPIA